MAFVKTLLSPDVVELVKLNILSSVVTLVRYQWWGGGSTLLGKTKNVMHSKISSFCRQSLSVTSVYHIMLGVYHLLSPVQ